MADPQTVTARCADEACGFEWVVCYLPMQLDKAAMLMRRAACPKCAHERPVLAHD